MKTDIPRHGCLSLILATPLKKKGGCKSIDIFLYNLLQGSGLWY